MARRRISKSTIERIVDVESRLLLRYTVAVMITPTSSSDASEVLGASATLVVTNGCRLALTCKHVVERFWKLAHSGSAILQIGNLRIPDEADRFIPAPGMDICAIRLDGLDILKISSHTEIGTRFFDLDDVPPESPREGDIIVLAGFPRGCRQEKSKNDIEFNSFAIDGSEVQATSRTGFRIRHDPRSWRDAIKYKEINMDHDFGGLSGAPIAVFRRFTLRLLGIHVQYLKRGRISQCIPLTAVEADECIRSAARSS